MISLRIMYIWILQTMNNLKHLSEPFLITFRQNSNSLKTSLGYSHETKIKFVNTYLTFKFSQTQFRTNWWAGDSCSSSSSNNSKSDNDSCMLLCIASSISAKEGATPASINIQCQTGRTMENCSLLPWVLCLKWENLIHDS